MTRDGAYTVCMSGSKSKRPRPSYEEGKTRDPEIERLQECVEDGGDERRRLLALIRRADSLRAVKG